jgi:glycosyltransferase involved in cell wall biosynthesis
MRAMEKPMISIVIPVLNSRATLARCLDSALAQKDASCEVVVVDGASTDGSLDILRSYGERLANWDSHADGGVYPAFNRGVRRSRGDWIYILGSDDYLCREDVMRRMSPHLARAAPEFRVVYGQVRMVNERNEALGVAGEPWPHFRRRFLQGQILPHQAVFHHRSLFEERGPFNESFRVAGDYEFLLRELKDRPALFVPDLVVAAYQMSGGSSVPENWLRVLHERRLAFRLNGIRFPGLLWYAFAARILVRTVLWKILGARAAGRLIDWGRALLGKPAFWTRI